VTGDRPLNSGVGSSLLSSKGVAVIPFLPVSLPQIDAPVKGEIGDRFLTFLLQHLDGLRGSAGLEKFQDSSALSPEVLAEPVEDFTDLDASLTNPELTRGTERLLDRICELDADTLADECTV